jgi:hypothetical protein
MFKKKYRINFAKRSFSNELYEFIIIDPMSVLFSFQTIFSFRFRYTLNISVFFEIGFVLLKNICVTFSHLNKIRIEA